MRKFELFLIYSGFIAFYAANAENETDKLPWKIAGIQLEYVIKLDDSQEHIVSGFHFELFKILQERLKFTYKIVKPIPKTFGGRDKNGSAIGMYGQLINNEAEFAYVPIKTPAQNPNWKSIINSFSYEIWMILIASIIVFGLILHRVINTNFSESRAHETWSRGKTFWFLFGSSANQAENETDKLPWKIAGIQLEYVIKLDDSQEHIVSGFHFELFKILQERLKFTYKIVKPIPKTFGGRDKNGSAIGMYGQLINNEAEFAYVPIKTPAQNPNWKSIINSFSYEIWMILIASIIVFGLILHRVINTNFSESQAHETWSRGKTFWFLFGSSANQGGNLNNVKRLAARIMIGIWLLSVVVILSCYNSKLTSFMTSPIIDLVPRTVQELALTVKNGEYVCGVLPGGPIQKFIMSSELDDVKVLANHIRQRNNYFNVKDGFQRVLEGHFALIGYDDTFKVFMKKHGSEKFLLSRDAFATFTTAYISSKEFPYNNAVSKIVSRLFEAGIIDFHTKESNEIAESSAVRPLTYEDFLGPIFLILCGYMLSTLSFVFELFSKNV
ncbi:glutamate receptor ionotropic, kainate 4-like [Centruroides sculpturatus]|uniref:glutamate receptor ionotropic, kainate 4-like n=1 Tax=Centruroides sculpturatus TaxID=218467 RepID=UPI000C6E2821|nr:glutamate receptor ionotropic, kainate 4-like [Centruroides sculpturatus]